MTSSAPALSPRRALMVLNALPHAGPVTVRRLLAAFDGDAARLLEAPPHELRRVKGVGEIIAQTIAAWREHFDVGKEEAALAERGGTFVTPDDEGYPPLLRSLHDPPLGLYALGAYAGADRAVAIVGSRRATLYGTSVARRLAGDLARLGFWVVSGGARGIDAAAHEGALAAGGKTAVVLGNGLDMVYPPEHLELFRQIAAQGAVLSEFPLGRRADRQTFPMRNRLIAGMCRGIVVVESDVNGGSMITAAQAIEQGREVFAVPGRVDQAASRGCHKLIRDGEAKLITGVEDMLVEWARDGQLNIKLDQPLPAMAGAADAETLAALGDDARRIYEKLSGANPTHPEELAASVELPTARVSAGLLLLELKRLVVKRMDGRFEAR